ncbi:unnamed protein product [Clonostachys byssicola]|uniref:RRM domain-containing protein n=1 Tax=Clonostachys byssicola TaxID=160290 RepID=A0A9N9Y1U0_9HYPO|nr:unnamed protein product [Clonostachys byssicola]
MEHPSREEEASTGPSAEDREPTRAARSNNWRARDSFSPPRNDNYNSRNYGNDRRSRNDYNQDRLGDGYRNNRRDYGRRNDWGSRRDDGASFRSSKNVAEGSDAIAEGRRIYVGNILYHVRPEQISEAFAAEGFTNVDQIHISIDPVTGRNPGYCFVEFETREVADNAIQRMSRVPIEGRPLQTGPCRPKKQQQSARQQYSRPSRDPTFQRWGNWDGEGGQVMDNGQGPIGAEEHLANVVEDDQRCRVFVGGLDKMINQVQNDEELREIFKDFKVVAVSKRITPHESTRARPGKHHYAFVDLETREDVSWAIETLDGTLWKGTRLKVQPPAGIPKRIVERGTRWKDSGEQALDDGFE